MDRLPPGSRLIISHITADFDPAVGDAVEVYRARGVTARARSREEIARFFDGLDLVEPGIQPVHRWRPDHDTDVTLADAEVSVYGAVAIKP